MVTATLERKQLRWQNDDPATQALFEPMLDDMFGPATDELTHKARAATIEACAKLIRASEMLWTMGDMQAHAGPFYEGYLTGLKEACL